MSCMLCRGMVSSRAQTTGDVFEKCMFGYVKCMSLCKLWWISFVSKLVTGKLICYGMLCYADFVISV